MFLYRLHAPNMQKLGKAVILIPLLFSLLGCDGPQQFEDGIAARDNHDYETARKIFSRLADQGDARAQDELAWMYAYGQGVEKNTTKALELLHSAASRGDVLAQFHLGLLYDGYDRLMTEQPEKAFEWYMKAAQQGFSQAYFNIGMMYGNGNGVRQNYSEALKAFQEAAKAGDGRAKEYIDLRLLDQEGDAVQLQVLCPGQIVPPYSKKFSLKLLVADRDQNRWGILHLADGKWNFAGEIVESSLRVTPNLLDLNSHTWAWSGIPTEYAINFKRAGLVEVEWKSLVLERETCHRVIGPLREVPKENIPSITARIPDPSHVELPPRSTIQISSSKSKLESSTFTCTGLPCLLLPNSALQFMGANYITVIVLLSFLSVTTFLFVRRFRSSPKLATDLVPVWNKQPKLHNRNTMPTDAAWAATDAAKPRITDSTSGGHSAQTGKIGTFGQQAPNSPSVEFQAISRFLSRRAMRAAAALKNGAFDSGNMRDLVDAALYGDPEAALTLARITLRAQTNDIDRQRAEGIAWLSISLLLGQNRTWATAVRDELSSLRNKSSESVKTNADHIIAEIKRKIEGAAAEHSSGLC